MAVGLGSAGIRWAGIDGLGIGSRWVSKQVTDDAYCREAWQEFLIREI